MWVINMNEQFKPIEEKKIESSGFTTINEEPKPKPVNPVNISNEEVLRKLPDWNLEPPVEIDRGK